MYSYPKITTVFNRDPDNNYSTLLIGEYAEPEFEYLSNAEWVFREKIHGTNLRLIWQPEASPPVVLKGRREASQVPSFLNDVILNREGIAHRLRKQFGDTPACLYGEGYGAKMQKEGQYYLPDSHDFCLFDVRVGDWWLTEDGVSDVAEGLGFTRAPILGTGTISDMVQAVRVGFASNVASEPLIAEGIVAHPRVELCTRSGERILTKIKHDDFAGNSMLGSVNDV